jgi:hypothetical protein
MAQPITELPLFRLLFLPAIHYLFYWIRADWTTTSSRTTMRYESGSLRETPPDEVFTRRILTHSTRVLAVVYVEFHSVCRTDTHCSSFLPNRYLWAKTGATGSGFVHRFVLEFGGPRCRLNLLRVFVVFLSFARPIMEIIVG